VDPGPRDHPRPVSRRESFAILHRVRDGLRRGVTVLVQQGTRRLSRPPMIRRCVIFPAVDVLVSVVVHRFLLVRALRSVRCPRSARGFSLRRAASKSFGMRSRRSSSLRGHGRAYGIAGVILGAVVGTLGWLFFANFFSVPRLGLPSHACGALGAIIGWFGGTS